MNEAAEFIEALAAQAMENDVDGGAFFADEKDALAARADMTLIGVPLTAGAQKIDLVFDNSIYETGKLITLLALGFSILAWVGGILMGRTRSV